VRRIETAEMRRQAPVNDSEMVDEMFGFIDSQVDGAAEAGAPLAFKVTLITAVCTVSAADLLWNIGH